MALSEEEFKAWLDHPVTRDVRKVLSLRRESLKSEWEAGRYSDLTSHGYIMLNSAAIGECRGLAYVLDLSHADLIQELEDGND